MDKKIYLTNNQVVLNYNKAYPKSREVLLKSNTFRVYLQSLLTVVREIYKTWRHLQRFAFIKSDSSDDFGINTLVRRDSEMNDLILRTYRLFEERIMDRPNLVYRQIQAGTNACFSIHNRDSIWSERYVAYTNDSSPKIK